MPIAAAAQTDATDPQTAQCQRQAQKLSGYRPSGLEWQSGQTRFRISGSVSLGVSKSSGGSAGTPQVPPFAGMAAIERREQQRQEEKRELYDRLLSDCLAGR